MILGSWLAFTFVDDSLYIADFKASTISVAGLDGVLHRQIGQRGQGPAEFTNLADLVYTNGHFFAGEESRIQVLSRNLEYVASTDPAESGPYLPGETLSASSTRLYAPCDLSYAFRVCPRSAMLPYEKGQPFLRSLGITKLAMDLLKLGVTPDGQYVIAAFAALPYLFVFDEHHEHIHTIRFFGKEVSAHARNYTTTRPGMPGIFLNLLLTNIHVLSDEYVAVPIRDRWHIIRIKDGGVFEHVDIVLLNHTISDDDGYVTGVTQARLHEGHLYVSTTRLAYILRYPFPH